VGVASSAEIHRGQIVVVFNPEGGVGKTTITIDTAATLQIRQS
jgi:cellulose biosynthesis protein BcsQ